MNASLFVEFCGESFELSPPDEFSFGRLGALQIDDNNYLHRVMGLFTWRNDLWWLTNVGAHLPLHIEGCVGGSNVTLSPGSSIPLVFGASYIRFAAGPTSYEIRLDTQGIAPYTVDLTVGGTPTVDAGDMPLSPEQLLLIVALAETRLRRGHTAELPTNQEVAGRFGWPMTKFNRKLDNVCMKFHRKGVGGLVGTADRMAQHRRTVLVDHVIASGLVTTDQLSLLPQRRGSGPPSRSQIAAVP
jgi:hypothetical protein